MIDETFSRLVKSRREKLNMSQQQLADSCGLTRANIMHIEGEKQKIYLFQALKIAEVLGITGNELSAVLNVVLPEANNQLTFESLKVPVEKDSS